MGTCRFHGEGHLRDVGVAGGGQVEGLLGAMAGVWERSGNAPDPVVLDIDSALVEVHSEDKQGE